MCVCSDGRKEAHEVPLMQGVPLCADEQELLDGCPGGCCGAPVSSHVEDASVSFIVLTIVLNLKALVKLYFKYVYRRSHIGLK